MPFRKSPSPPTPAGRLKLLTQNLESPHGDSLIEQLAECETQSRLAIQRASLFLILASALAVGIAGSLYLLEHYPDVMLPLLSNRVAEAILLATFALSVLSYSRRVHTKFFSVYLSIIVAGLYLFESQFIHLVGNQIELYYTPDAVRLSCVLIIVLLGYVVHRFRKSVFNSNSSLFLVASTRVFLTHCLPFLALMILLGNAFIDRIFTIDNAGHIEGISIQFAYSLLLLSALIDVFAVNHNNPKYATKEKREWK